MFNLLQPIWMFAVAGIAIPIALHLWNVRQGKVLKVGSVALLTEQPVKNSSSIKLNELLLLLLRCLLITLAAVLLAKPQWTPAKNTAKNGWVLIPKAEFSKTYSHFKPLVDSLLGAGYSLHYFDASFEEKKVDEALKEEASAQDAGKAVDYWKTIAQLNRVVDTTLPLYIFTNNQLSNFSGSRPGVSLKLVWQTFTVDDSLQQHLAGAYKTYDGGIRVVTANSTPTGTSIAYNTVAEAGLAAAGYSVQANGKLNQKGKIGSAVLLDTAPLNITVYTGSYPTDAGYIKAAIDAIREFSKKNINLRLAEKEADIAKGQEWVFWLSDKPMPPNIIAKNILQYEAGKQLSASSWVQTAGGYTVNETDPALNEFTVPTPNSTISQSTLWRDGFGNPLLTLENGKTNVYHFYTHFNPAYNGLAWGGNFAQLLFTLLVNTDKPLPANDARIIDAVQLQPYPVSANVSTTQITKQPVDLAMAAWLAMAVIYLLERIVAHSHKKEGLLAA